MSDASTTVLSSKGQVVIPEAIRQRLDLRPGTSFLVMGENDVVILKTIAAPSLDQFDDLVARARKLAKKEGLTSTHVAKAIRSARAKK